MGVCEGREEKDRVEGDGGIGGGEGMVDGRRNKICDYDGKMKGGDGGRRGSVL